MVVQKSSKTKYNNYEVKSKYIANKKGFLVLKIKYYSISYGEINENQTSTHTVYSRKTVINNSSFREEYNNAVWYGGMLHNKKFRRRSEQSWTYNVQWYRIVYVDSRPFQISHNQKTNNVKVKKGESIRIYKQEKNIRTIRKDVNNRINNLQKQKKNDKIEGSTQSRKDFNKMFK